MTKMLLNKCLFVLLSVASVADISHSQDNFSEQYDIVQIESRPFYFNIGNQLGNFVINGIVNLGDVNGDGIEDLGVGSLQTRQSAGSSRTHAIVFGSSSFDSQFDIADIDGHNGIFLSCTRCLAQANTGDRLTISAIGDFNGDGKHDVMVSSRADAASSRQVSTSLEHFVVFGGALHDGLDPSAITNKSSGFILKGFDAVFPVGDINADGKDDLGFFQAPSLKPDETSKPCLGAVFGSADIAPIFDYLDNFKRYENGFALDYECFPPCLVHRWHGGGPTGDVNGDGIGDMVVTLTTGQQPTGYNIVIFGNANARDFPTSESRIDGHNGFLVEETNCKALSCRAKVMGGGDINGDGVDDLIGVDSGYGTSQFPDQGRAAVLFGTQDPFPKKNSWEALDGKDGFKIVYGDMLTKRKFGSDAAAIGDINADGHGDFAVAQFGGNDHVYAVFVFLGGPRHAIMYVDDCDGSRCFSLRYSKNTTDPVRFAFALENFKRFRGRRPNASALAILRQEDQGYVDFVRLSDLKLPTRQSTSTTSTRRPKLSWQNAWLVGGIGVALGLVLASVIFVTVFCVVRRRGGNRSKAKELSAPLLKQKQKPSVPEPILYNARGKRRRTSTARDLDFAHEDEDDDLDEYLT